MSEKKVELKPINEDILGISAKIDEAVKKSIEANDKKPLDEEVFLSTLPEGLEKETVVKVVNHIGDFSTALSLSTGNHGISGMTKDKELKSVEVKAKLIGHNSVTARIDRKTVTTNPRDRSVQITNYGNLSVDLHLQADNKKAGQLSVVQQHLREAATKALAEV